MLLIKKNINIKNNYCNSYKSFSRSVSSKRNDRWNRIINLMLEDIWNHRPIDKSEYLKLHKELLKYHDKTSLQNILEEIYLTQINLTREEAAKAFQKARTYRNNSLKRAPSERTIGCEIGDYIYNNYNHVAEPPTLEEENELSEFLGQIPRKEVLDEAEFREFMGMQTGDFDWDPTPDPYDTLDRWTVSYELACRMALETENIDLTNLELSDPTCVLFLARNATTVFNMAKIFREFFKPWKGS